MHGENLSCFFLFSGELLSDSKLSHAHAYNIYIGMLLSEKIIIILKKVAEKFGRLKKKQ